VRAVEDADIVLDAPSGPLIGDIWGGGWKELFCLLRLYIPARRGKLVFFYAPSMGPFSGRMMNWMRRRVISKARGVIVRECISAKYLREQLAIESEVTADSAFQNQISASYLERYKNNHNLSDTLGLIDSVKVVGVSILDVRWMPPYKGKDELQNAIESSMTALINWLIAEGYYILLLPQMFGFDPESELLDRFSNLNVEKIRVLDKNCDAYCQQVIISKLFAVVSMRYHPTIFASKASVPALCISYEHKMQGLAEKMGRSDLIITLDEVDAQTLIARFTYLENNYDTIKQELTKASQRLVKESQKTTERIIDELP
jgi:colanic acid/amylovoran biosynthesis protein